MKLPTLAAGLVLAAMATPALAGPYQALDASPSILVMIDRGSIERSGAHRIASTLYVIKGNQPVVFTTRFHCATQTFEEIHQRTVARTLTLGAPIVGSSGTVTAAAGSLGAAVLANVCQDKVLNASGGWTRPDLKRAIDAAIGLGYVPVWP